ncbi:hypothetical protein, partial [Spirochaeta cellobiosiphila]|uniref:hypothetical protein n=1 Tax=Spirochaeta cellobiosiphila TaxID=504483 RepID=UPI00048FAC46
MKKTLKKLIGLMFLILFLGCSDTATTSKDNRFKVSNIEWKLYNYDKDYFPKNRENDLLAVSWRFDYTGNKSQLKSIEFTDGQSTWNGIGQSDLDWKSNSVRIKKNIYSFDYGKIGSTLRTGVYTFTFTMVDDSTSTISMNLPIPGSTTDKDYNYITIDPALFNTTGYAPMIPTAKNLSAKQNGTSYTITFSANSNLIYDGWVNFYDKDKEYVGMYYYFRDDNNNISKELNNGSQFYTDGQ